MNQKVHQIKLLTIFLNKVMVSLFELGRKARSSNPPTELSLLVIIVNLKEILLQPTLLARQGQLSKQQTHSLASTATKYGLNPVLVWDILMPEQTMKNICQQLSLWELSKFPTVRVCDPGAAWWLKTHHPNIALQLNT